MHIIIQHKNTEDKLHSAELQHCISSSSITTLSIITISLITLICWMLSSGWSHIFPAIQKCHCDWIRYTECCSVVKNEIYSFSLTYNFRKVKQIGTNTCFSSAQKSRKKEKFSFQLKIRRRWEKTVRPNVETLNLTGDIKKSQFGQKKLKNGHKMWMTDSVARAQCYKTFFVCNLRIFVIS